MRKLVRLSAALVVVAAACGDGDGGETAARDQEPAETEDEASLTIYSGREEELVGELLGRFERESGITVNVRYGESAELAAQILEEGDNSPADVFFAQDAGALGSLQREQRLVALPRQVLDLIPQAFRSKDGLWVGTSGRARTVVYNTEAVGEDDLPDSILDFTDPEWKGKIGWAPTNASFQSFVTALRKVEGEDAARRWLEGIKANDAEVYPKNTPIVEAVISGEIEVGFVNHYYLLRILAQDPEAPAANHFLSGGDVGALVNVAGIGVLASSEEQDAALDLVRFLLSEESQSYFATETFEYPLTEKIAQAEGLPPLAEIEQPDVDLSDLDDLQGTLALLAEVGLV